MRQQMIGLFSVRGTLETGQNALSPKGPKPAVSTCEGEGRDAVRSKGQRVRTQALSRKVQRGANFHTHNLLWEGSMTKEIFAAVTKIGFVLLLLEGVAAEAAEIKILGSAGVRGPLEELGRQFEGSSGHKVTTSYEVTAILRRKIDDGEMFDVAILNPEGIDVLIRMGKIVADTRANFGRTGLAVATRKGTPKPDISSAEAFKRTMLNAKSVAYSKEGLSGLGFLAALARLGITEEMRPRLKAYDTDGSLPAVVSGEAELVVIAIGPILAVPAVELVGMLPAELQT
jgi:molybdate transport system substrate-binding protein